MNPQYFDTYFWVNQTRSKLHEEIRVVEVIRTSSLWTHSFKKQIAWRAYLFIYSFICLVVLLLFQSVFYQFKNIQT